LPPHDTEDTFQIQLFFVTFFFCKKKVRRKSIDITDRLHLAGMVEWQLPLQLKVFYLTQQTLG
jgi:hypothetical protein